RHRSPDRRTNNSRFGYGRIDQAFRTVLSDKVLRNAIGTTIAPDLLADHDDGVVFRHGVIQRFAQRVAVSHGNHYASSLESMRSIRVRTGSGSGSPTA